MASTLTRSPVLLLLAGVLVGAALGELIDGGRPGPAKPISASRNAPEADPSPDAAGRAGDVHDEPGAGPPVEAPALSGSDPDLTPERVAALKEEVVRLREQVAELQQAEAERLAAEAAARPTFTFGAAGQLPGVRNADWGALAAASEIVNDAIKQMQAHREAGEEIPREVLIRLQQNTERMRTYEYDTIGKITTAAKHNGELTHPISITNLFASRLRAAGVPLDDEQIQQIEALGLAFERDHASMRETYGEGYPRTRRMLEEYRLKGAFMEKLYGLLDAAQRDVLIDPETHRIARLDLYDPTLMIIHTTRGVMGSDAGQIADNLRTAIGKEYAIDPDAWDRLDPLVQRWRERTRDIMQPVHRVRARNFDYAQGLVAAEATVELYESLLATDLLTDAQREKLLDDYTLYVPRLLEP